MTDLNLTKTHLRGGVWEGQLTGAGDQEPVLALRHDGEILPGLSLTADGAGVWHVRAPVPVDRINDDLQTFVITDETKDEILSQFVVFAGEAFEEDLRAEVELLRAELDLLKRAFRRHCIDTA